jgi:hypothetical protein
MVQPTPALAVIDGALCQLNREGARTAGYQPLATAVVEFRHAPLRVIVREHPYGLLPGIPNLYCLDGDLRLQWMAEWPEAAGPCTRILEDNEDVLIAESALGAVVRLDAHNGRLIAVEAQLAAVG